MLTLASPVEFKKPLLPLSQPVVAAATLHPEAGEERKNTDRKRKDEDGGSWRLEIDTATVLLSTAISSSVMEHRPPSPEHFGHKRLKYEPPNSPIKEEVGEEFGEMMNISSDLEIESIEVSTVEEDLGETVDNLPIVDVIEEQVVELDEKYENLGEIIVLGNIFN